MTIEFETTKKTIYTFEVDVIEEAKFLEWQTKEIAPTHEDFLKYLKDRDLSRNEIHFKVEVENMIVLDDDE